MIHLKNLPCNPESCAVFGVRRWCWVEIYSFNIGFVCYTQIDPPDGGKYTHTGAGVTSVNKQIKRVIIFWNNINNIPKVNFIVENCKIWLIEMLTCCSLLWGMKGWKIKNQEIKLSYLIIDYTFTILFVGLLCIKQTNNKIRKLLPFFHGWKIKNVSFLFSSFFYTAWKT